MAKVVQLRLLRRIGPPIWRKDIWPFLLLIYPFFSYLTYATWDRWHISAYESLSSSDVYSPIDPSQINVCPWIRWIFDAAQSLPYGVPQLYPDSELPVSLLEPLLKQNNFSLLLWAGWAATIILNILVIIFPVWMPAYGAWALYSDVSTLDQATHVLVHAPLKKKLFCRLYDSNRFRTNRATGQSTVEIAKSIEYMKKKYFVLDAPKAVKTQDISQSRVDKYRCLGACYDHPICLVPPAKENLEKPLAQYRKCLTDFTGFNSKKEIENHEAVYGKNEQDIPIPSFMELFGEHAVQPLFVFQIFCLLLWLVDEYWQYSMMTLIILVVFEGQIVYRRRKDLSMIKGMHMPPCPVAVRRFGQWWKLSSSELLPGDLFSLAMSNDLKTLKPAPGSIYPIPKTRFSSKDSSVSAPCDALILQGSVIANEAMLTGESLPQMKYALDSTANDTEALDLNTKHKGNSLFAGTSILMESNNEDKTEIGGSIYYCLRTGFQTTQGKLIRTVLYSSERATAASREALWFLAVLTGVAVLASAYVLRVTWNRPDRNHFKLLLHCIMIITSVVPPELPITMSLTVTMAVTQLFKKTLYCTEPFRIPLAGKLTVCCFDKTGTLTTSEVILESVVQQNEPQGQLEAFKKTSSEEGAALTKEPLSERCELVMGLCHSVVAVPIKNKLPLSMRNGVNASETSVDVAGDPLEKVAVNATRWVPEVGRPDNLVNKKSPMKAQVVRRFPFVSEEQRMTVVVAIEDEDSSDTRYYVLCKGAAERLKTILKSTPSWYDKTVAKLALEGRRVLVMGAGQLFNVNKAALKTISRAELESHLNYCGILIYGCPIKPKTVETIKILSDSGHQLVTITGDDPRTAAYVSLECGIVPPNTKVWLVERCEREESTLILTLTTRDGSETRQTNLNTLSPQLVGGALCLTGRDLAELTHEETKIIVPQTAIFARVTPRDKEMILRTFKEVGNTTLMCGDGTNDVGALKAADVGISLLNFDIDRIKKNKKDQLAKIKTAGEIPEETLQESRSRRLELGLSAAQIAHLEQTEEKNRAQTQVLSQVLPKSFRLAGMSVMRKNIAILEERMAQANLAMASGQQAPPTKSSPFDDMEDDVPLLRPGDASMASPFTYRGQNIKCVKLLVRSGKATLATVMMMYKLMALNSLTTAISLSVLTMNGVKFGDSQATIESVFTSVLFMATSNAKASKDITKDRIIDSLFAFHFYMSIIGQTLVHAITCGLAWYLAATYAPAAKDLDGPFKPNLVNTVIFLMNAAQHATSFTANYEGRPFLVSMKENRVLGKGLVAFIAALLIITAEMFPLLNSSLKLVPFPSPTFRAWMVALVIIDLVGASAVGRICTHLGRKRMLNLQKNKTY